MTIVATSPTVDADQASAPFPEQADRALPGRTSTARQLRDERTADCVLELAQCTDPQEDQRLRTRLISLNIPMATALASRYRNRGQSDDDLEQVAYVGLCSAARRFDPAVADSFASYCVPTVLGELRRHFRDRGWVVRPPRRVQEVQMQVLRAQSAMSGDLGRDPTPAELAEHVGSPVEDVVEALAVRSCYVPTSLDKPVGGEHDAPALNELLPGAPDGSAAAEARMLLGPAVRDLGERDRRILRMRFFDDLTQREIAEDVGVTQMQVSRVLTRIFSDLRSAIGDREG